MHGARRKLVSEAGLIVVKSGELRLRADLRNNGIAQILGASVACVDARKI